MSKYYARAGLKTVNASRGLGAPTPQGNGALTLAPLSKNLFKNLGRRKQGLKPATHFSGVYGTRPTHWVCAPVVP